MYGEGHAADCPGAAVDVAGSSGREGATGSWSGRPAGGGLGRRVTKLVPAGSDWDLTGYYHNGRWQVVEERFAAGLAGTGTAAAGVSAQYVWCLRYIDSPILRDRDADGNPATRAPAGLEQ